MLYRQKFNFLQSFSGPIQQSLAERFILRDCLKNVAVGSDVADGPLAQPGAAQAKNVAEKKRLKC